jgi:hypothetical protein
VAIFLPKDSLTVVTSHAPANGGVASPTLSKYECGDSATVTATPNENWSFFY